jgi:hypothetical protein
MYHAESRVRLATRSISSLSFKGKLLYGNKVFRNAQRHGAELGIFEASRLERFVGYDRNQFRSGCHV